MDLVNYGLRERYEQVKKRGDKLDDIKRIIDWESLRPLLKDLFANDTDQGGRPNYDEILMVKILFLQSIYNIVDESMETEIYDSVRFINFLDYPEKVPDQNTIWLFRERLSKTGKDKALWKDIWRQFKEKGITIRNGTIQDATFIESNEDIIAAMNQLNQELTEVKEKLERMEKAQPSKAIASGDKPKEFREPLQEISKISLKVKRKWGIKANDADNSVDIHEKREKEEGGDINVEMTDGNGSVIWKVTTTQLGHSILYERIKKVLVEFLAAGDVSTDLTYSFPKENEPRNFMPELKSGSVWFMDNWPVKRGLFNQKYERPLTFIVGSSSWTVDVRMKVSDVQDLKSALTSLMDMVLLSGEVASQNDSRSFK